MAAAPTLRVEVAVVDLDSVRLAVRKSVEEEFKAWRRGVFLAFFLGGLLGVLVVEAIK